MAARKDRALAKALASGQPEAAEELAEATYRMIYATLFRLTGGDGELAADLTQETYRKAWAALPSFAGRAQFSTWLYRIAYTTYLNHARRPRLFVPMEPSVSPTDPAPREDDRIDRDQTEERLRRAVLELPDDLRFAVTAHYWQEVPISEIALLEEVTTAAIRKRLRRAVRLLALALGERKR
ncbi:MAG: RNA polymerase sigma factor [Thermoanaerobaculia bacterium]